MEVTVWQLVLLCWGALVVGAVIGWFLAALFTCGKIDDLEREIRKRDLMLAEAAKR